MRTKNELYQQALRTVAMRRQTARALAQDAQAEAEAAIPGLRHAEEEVRVRGIRCAMVSEPYSALMARRHNDANMIAIGARVIGTEVAKMIVRTFLTEEFEGGRHARRVGLIMDVEKREAAE